MAAESHRSISVGLLLLSGAFLGLCIDRNPPEISPSPVIAASLPTVSAADAPVHVLTASYYSNRFNGRKTADGERYNPNRLTAASKTLPLGSVVKVQNPANGRSVKVRINDRGPYIPGRDLDLSRRAARNLGILHQGVTPVKVMMLATNQTPHSMIRKEQ